MKESKAIILINHTMPKGNSAIDIQLRGALNMAIQALEEKQQYNEIGTIEELKTLKEKNVAKKPDFTEDKQFALCPNISCNSKGLKDKQQYCDCCGQKLDWQ